MNAIISNYSLICCTCYIIGLKMCKILTKRFVFNAEELKAYWDLKKFLANPTDIVDVLKALIFAVDNGQGGNNFPNKLVSSQVTCWDGISS